MGNKRLVKSEKKERKIAVLVMLSATEINYLDSKIEKKNPEKKSRSALIRFLIKKSKI